MLNWPLIFSNFVSSAGAKFLFVFLASAHFNMKSCKVPGLAVFGMPEKTKFSKLLSPVLVSRNFVTISFIADIFSSFVIISSFGEIIPY